MTRQRSASSLLEKELKNLQGLEDPSPLVQAVIQRMIQRELELKAVLEKILRYPKEARSEEEQELEQRKLIWLIAHAAAESGGNHQSTSAPQSIRAARSTLKKKLNDLGKQAEKLAATIEDINALCEHNGLELPTWMTFNVLELMQKAAPHSRNHRVTAAFKLVAGGQLEELHQRFFEYLPSLSDILQVLAQVSKKDYAQVEDNYWFDLNRQEHPANDFIRTLILRIDSLRPPNRFEMLGFDSNDLLTLAEVCLDLDPDDDAATTRGINNILKEHRERKASEQSID